VTARTTYTITVGGGGAKNTAMVHDFVFSTITSTGGGRGGAYLAGAGGNGGSGGGGAGWTSTSNAGGTGNVAKDKPKCKESNAVLDGAASGIFLAVVSWRCKCCWRFNIKYHCWFRWNGTASSISALLVTDAGGGGGGDGNVTGTAGSGGSWGWR